MFGGVGGWVGGGWGGYLWMYIGESCTYVIVLHLFFFIPSAHIFLFTPNTTPPTSPPQHYSSNITPSTPHPPTPHPRHKLPVIEPRDAASFPAAAQDYKDKLNDRTSKGAVFFAVCRGKVSEGIDFIDRAGRAVVITGIPFPPSYDPKVAAKKQVLNGLLRGPRHGGHHQQGLSGEQWYQQQATRAVNQAIGRVIRHVHDYGAILLCDERFREPVQQNALSKWVRGNVQEYATFGAANSALAQFFKVVIVCVGGGGNRVCGLCWVCRLLFYMSYSNMLTHICSYACHQLCS